MELKSESGPLHEVSTLQGPSICVQGPRNYCKKVLTQHPAAYHQQDFWGKEPSARVAAASRVTAQVELDGVCAAVIADQAHVPIEQWECQVRLGPQNVAVTGTYLHIGTHDEERVLAADRQHRACQRRRREQSQPHIPQPRRTLAQRGRIHHHPGIAGRGDALDNRPHRSRGLLLSTLTLSLTFSRAFGRSSLSFTYSGS